MASDVSSTESLDELIERAKSSQRHSQLAFARYRAAQQEHWEQLAGSAAKQMLQNRETAHVFLRDADPQRRLAALSILLHHWKPDTNLALVAEKLAFDDPDPDVREVALLAVGDCFSGANDGRIAQLLAGIVNDSAQPEKFRKAAYLGLFKVCRPVQSWPDVATFRFPDDVNWDFVQSLVAA